MGRGSRTDQALAERPAAQEEGAREAAGRGAPGRAAPRPPRFLMAFVTAVHLYVTDLDVAIDFYRLLGYGPRPRTTRARARTARSSCWRSEPTPFSPGIPSAGARSAAAPGRARRRRRRARDRALQAVHRGDLLASTRFGTEVYDLADPDGHLIRIGPAWPCTRSRRRLTRQAAQLPGAASADETIAGPEAAALAFSGRELEHRARLPKRSATGRPRHTFRTRSSRSGKTTSIGNHMNSTCARKPRGGAERLTPRQVS